MYFFYFFIISYDFIFLSWCSRSRPSCESSCVIKSQPNKTQLKEMEFKNDKYSMYIVLHQVTPPPIPQPSSLSNNNCNFTYSICPSGAPFSCFPQQILQRKKNFVVVVVLISFFNESFEKSPTKTKIQGIRKE